MPLKGAETKGQKKMLTIIAFSVTAAAKYPPHYLRKSVVPPRRKPMKPGTAQGDDPKDALLTKHTSPVILHSAYYYLGVQFVCTA